MRSLLRSIILGAAALSGSLVMAQNLFVISGTVSPCQGVIYPVHIVTNSVPPLDTTIYTSSNCQYYFDISLPSPQFAGVVETSCDGGITWTSANFTWNVFLGTAVVDLSCPGCSSLAACYTVSNPQPWVLQFNDCTSGGTPPYTYAWNINGQFSALQNPSITLPPAPTVLSVQLSVTDSNNCTNWEMDSLFLDSVGNLSIYDCLGTLGGWAMPGVWCDDNDPLTQFSFWDWSCACVSNGMLVDCLGAPNGTALPGTPCDDNDPLTSNDTWDANCICTGSSPLPCEAGFFVMQGYVVDSMGTPTPILNELWILNTSSGGSGNYTFVWDFGDGTSSTDPYPVHIYPNGGPYVLCLTIDDGAGCSDTYCDSISVDANGIYQGMAGGEGSRAAMTINVVEEITAGVIEQPMLEGLTLWPNPVTDELNMTVSSDLQGRIPVSVIDMSGRCVMAMYRTLTGGTNRFVLPTGALEPGVYLLHVGNGRNALNQRFVKNP